MQIPEKERQKIRSWGWGIIWLELLTENYGYQVMHVTEAFDLAGGELDRSKAYDYARAWLEPVLEEKPSIQILIDLHRMAYRKTAIWSPKLTENRQRRSCL